MEKTLAAPTGDAVARWLRQARRLSGDGSGRFAESEIGLVQLGPARMAAVPGLLAPQVGSQVRKMLDAPYRFVLSTSNDNLGYIPQQAVPSTTPDRISQIGTIVLDELDRLLLDARLEAGQVFAENDLQS